MFRLKKMAFIIIISMSFFTGCDVFSSDEYSKEDILKVVNDNVSLLNSAVEEIDKFPEGTLILTTEKVENEVLNEVIKIKPIRSMSSSDEWVMFDCSSSRFGPSSYGQGFYYSRKNEPKDVLGIIPEGKFNKDEDSWRWNEENGDNSYYTERITGKLFYFEFSF